MKKKAEDAYDFSPETVERKRKFPVLATVFLCGLVLLQIFCVLSICLYRPEPQDVIEDYTIYISPQMDGSLNIKYCFTWTPLDPSEDLTWVEIGMANDDYTILEDRSDNINSLSHYEEDGYCSARVYFDRPYRSGETLYFYFTVNQKRILTTNGTENFYEFIPGWFNGTPVKHYSFYFEKYGDIASYNGDDQDMRWLKWEGTLDPGCFVRIRVNYRSFDAPAVHYKPFNGEGCYDDLASDKAGATAAAILGMVVAFVIELGIIDSYVSYSRGRGFLRGYGHHVHVYGHINPRYRTEASKHRGSGGLGGGRGCACACACACAGGGRAGCSQKDTYHRKKDG